MSLANELPSPEKVRRLVFALEKLWRCDECGYQRSSPARPTQCPACGADSERFQGMSAVEWRNRLGDGAG